jgi:hypothetical protein
MKRAADTPDEKGKRAKRSLEFLGTCEAAWQPVPRPFSTELHSL